MPTIGVSIAVPDPGGAHLQDYRITLGDDEARGIPTHITLLPPHEVAESDLADVEAHLAGVATQTSPFQVHLRGTGTFRPISPVVFVGVVAGIADCEQLTAAVRRGPLTTEARFPYHPHVTVAHDIDEQLLDKAFADLADFEEEFEVGEFHLYMHEQAAGWRPVRTFTLGG